MGDLRERHWRGWWLGIGAILVVGTTAAAGYLHFLRPHSAATANVAPAQASTVPESVATPSEIRLFCSRCHAYPPADTFPRAAWDMEVRQAYKFFMQSNLFVKAPPIQQVIQYYEQRAPEELSPAVIETAKTPLPLRFEPLNYPVLPQFPMPAISNLNLVHLFDERRLDVLACDMRNGLVLALSPYAASPVWRVLAHIPNPAHTEVVDLDGDGIKDILVANLGNLEPTDRLVGSVVWLRGKGDGTFTPIALMDGVGRVADVQAADFRGTGKLDLVVACFGWNRTGEVYFLENQTTDWVHPNFARRIVDDRHGAIHVPVGDINGDGKPDFVALISQEHEVIVAFLNEGNGHFRKETIYRGPHPAYASSGIQLVDLNGDGKLDVLYTNGDTMDPPYQLRPYHSIQWLENQGHFPFKHHPITPMYGVHRAVAADFRGIGKLDIVASAYLPQDRYPQREQRRLDSLIYLEQTSPGTFVRHSLETVACDHVTCVAGDIFGSGKIDVVTGNLVFSPCPHMATIWRNQGTQVAGLPAPLHPR
jgi:hypothetical protein